MVAFAYTARTKTGEKATGTVDAADKRSATQAIERMGYVPISVRESGGAAPGKGDNGRGKGQGKGRGAREKNKKETGRRAKSSPEKKETDPAAGAGKKLKLRELLDFTREMKDLITSGMTLGQALDSLARRENASPAQAFILNELREDIINGKSLSGALLRHPKTFSPFYTSMVRAGEASGQLPTALDNIIVHNERIQEARENIVGALIYPVVVLVIGLGAIAFLMAYVVPQFSKIFDEMDMVLPLPTRILMGISDFATSLWGVATLVLCVFGLVALKAWTVTPVGKKAWHSLLLRTPIIRSIVANNAFAQFSRTLGGLMENGVPVLNAMKITRDASTNVMIGEELERATERVADGATISGTLAEGGVFPTLLTDMLSVGERSGNVPKSLKHIAQRYDNDLKRSIDAFSKLIEPLLLVVLALLVGFVAVSMLSAVFQISNGLDGV